MCVNLQLTLLILKPSQFYFSLQFSHLCTCSKDFGPDHISKVRSNIISDLYRKNANFAELSLEIHDESKPPVTPLRVGSASLNECTQSGSQLRSVLKKTPAKELTDCIKVGLLTQVVVGMLRLGLAFDLKKDNL